MSTVVCGDPTPPFGENRRPLPDAVRNNDTWNQGYRHIQRYRGAGIPSVSSSMLPPSSIAGYRCQRAWSGHSPSKSVSHKDPMESMAWNCERAPTRPTSAPPMLHGHTSSMLSGGSRPCLRPLHQGFAGFTRPMFSAHVVAGISGPTSGGAWRPPSNSKRVFKPLGSDLPPADEGMRFERPPDPSSPPALPSGYMGYLPGNATVIGSSPLRVLVSADSRFGRPRSSISVPQRRPVTGHGGRG